MTAQGQPNAPMPGKVVVVRVAVRVDGRMLVGAVA
jgi:hypothetical protein